MSSEFLETLLRPARLRAGLSQGDLAARADVTRQAISAIETGRVSPTTQVALRLARVLSVRVEDLFRLVDELPRVTAEIVGAEPIGTTGPTRVQVADIRGRLVAWPLRGAAGASLTLPRANGLLRVGAARGRLSELELFVDQEQLQRTAIVVGCDPALELLSEHLRRRHPAMSLICQGGSSMRALEAVGRGEAHLAGVHLHDPTTGEYNRPFARRLLGNDVKLVTFAIWQQGLIVQSGNPKAVRGVEDLVRTDVRLVNREAGSGARALLDAVLTRASVAPDRVAGYGVVVRSHLAAAETVASGLADVALGAGVAAQALNLGFIPLAEERYDLAIPAVLFESAAVQAVLDTLTSPLFRREMEAFGSYNVTPMGNLVAAA